MADISQITLPDNNIYYIKDATARDDIADLSAAMPTKTSDLTNDSGFITGYTETDPTVPAWAKASTKPTYTASEVGALPDTTSYVSSFNGSSGVITYTAPVTSVAGHTGSVTLAASDITSGTFAAERIPVATSSAIGGIKVGPTLTIYNNDLNANIMVGATSTSAGSSGYVPMPGPGDVEKFLRGDGSWQTAGSASGVSITRYAATLDPSTWTYNSTYGWYEETVSV